MQITYVTEDPAKKYGKAIRKTANKEELIKVLTYYNRVADDALKIAKTFTDEDFKNFKRDLVKAKKEQSEEWVNKFNERFGVIAVPTKLLISSLVADQFHVPWGCAFIRAEELKLFNKKK